ncbi:MAG: hypothetical protein WCG04_02115 [Alphaproteobacteria bacterium]
MNKCPELIMFLEVRSEEIVNLIQDVEHIGAFHYPYEHHLTLGWFTDNTPETLRKFGKATMNYVQECIHKHAGAFLDEQATSLQITVDQADRQPVNRGGGFYVRPTEQCTQPLLLIHQELIAFLQRNHIRVSESISGYRPHVSLTTPIAQSLINQHQEKLILQTINDRIAAQQGERPGSITLHSSAIRAILKYPNEQGAEQKETWEIKVGT